MTRIACLFLAFLTIGNALSFQKGQGYIPPEGFVPDAQTAKAIARAVLTKVYGKKNIRGEEPLRARLEHQVWIIEGSAPHLTPPHYFMGGLAEVRISKKTGAILYMLHGK